MSPNLFRIILCSVVLAASLAQGETLQYLIPSFQTRAWRPPETETVTREAVYGWVTHPGTTRTIDPEPYWVGPTYKFITWPAEYGTIIVPARYDLRYVEPVVGVRTFEYTVVVPETGHFETTPESTGTRDEERTGWYEVWEDTSRQEFVFLDGWDGDYYWWWEGWITIPDGYMRQESYTYTVSVTYTIPGYTSWVVDTLANQETRMGDEIYIVSPGRDEEYSVSPEHTAQVLVRDAGSATVVDVEGHEVDPPPYTVTEPDRAIWQIIIPAYEEEQETNPGFWEDVTVPETTLSVDIDTVNININWLHWTAQSYKHAGQFDVELPDMGVPDYIEDFMANPEWFLADNDDNEDGTVLTATLAFDFAAEVAQQQTKPVWERKKHPRRTNGDGVWVLEERNGAYTVEEVREAIRIAILVSAQEASRKSTDRSEIFYYITYEKLQSYPWNFPRKVYSGRTSGRAISDAVTAEHVMERRERQHRIQRPHFGRPLINTIVVTQGFQKEAHGSMRGREQQLMDYHDWHAQPSAWPFYSFDFSHSENARPSPERPRGTRGVRRNHENGWDFHSVSNRAYMSEVWAFTGDRPWPNDPLQWPCPGLLLPPFFRSPAEYSWP